MLPAMPLCTLMKMILSPDKATLALCGVQKRKQVPYRWTGHMITVPCADGLLIYQTLTGALCLLSQEEQDSLCFDEQGFLLCTLDTPLAEKLIYSWFLVPAEFDECKMADDTRRLASLVRGTPKNKTSFTVLTTTDCNARCYYCYEMGIRRFPMTEAVARDVGNYIVRVSGGERVSLSWFGGEPLLNSAAIDTICGILRENNISYKSILTSNGYYLNQTIAEKAAKEWLVTQVQITLDGTAERYNRVKSYLHPCENPFARVLDNIDFALCVGIEVVIRLNMDRSNAKNLSDLVDVLAERFAGRENLYAHVILLVGISGPVHSFASEGEADACRKRLVEKLDRLGWVKKGTVSSGIRVNQCIADNDACEVILPDGHIQMCEHYDESEIVGSIYDARRDRAIIQKWKETVRFPNCRSCPLFPQCVSLRHCAWWKNGCSDIMRKNQLERIKTRVFTAYQKTGGIEL